MTAAVEPDLRGLRSRLVAWAAADEFVPLYAIYALLFEDGGLTAASISVGFVAWSATVVLLEVPSGALADRVSRRRLLAISTVVRAFGFSVWLLVSGLAGVVAGFILWGVAGALSSGTWQALTWDELARIGRSDVYTPVLARMQQASSAAVGLSILTAAPLVAVLGIRGVAVVSVGLHVVTLALTLRLPEVRPVRGVDEPTGFGAWSATLRTGVRTVSRTPALGRIVILLALLEMAGVIEEYVPLLARDLGATDVMVPVLVALPWIGNLLGAEVAARRPTLPRSVAAGLVGLAALLLIIGALADHPSGIVATGGTYALLRTVIVLAGARLQELAPDDARATVTSVSGFITEVLAIAAFALTGLLSAIADLPTAVALLAVPVAAAALVTRLWLPGPIPSGPSRHVRARSR